MPFSPKQQKAADKLFSYQQLPGESAQELEKVDLDTKRLARAAVRQCRTHDSGTAGAFIVVEEVALP